MTAHRLPYDMAAVKWLGVDPGDAGTFDLAGKSGMVFPIVTAGASESRTLSNPEAAGLWVTITHETDGGDSDIVVTDGYEPGATTTFNLLEAGDTVCLVSIKVGANFRWRAVANSGVSLTVASASMTFGDDNELVFGTGSDAAIMWSTGDASNHAFVIQLDNTSQQLHITDRGAKATDWGRSAGTHPELAIHSNTTPITDYLAIGGHDGTTANLDVVGGTTLDLDIAGTTAAAVTAGGISLTAGKVTMADGGTVTQATDHSTGVTLNTHSGQITLASVDLADDADIEFVVTNSTVAATDVVVICLADNQDTGTLTVTIADVGAGVFTVLMSNQSGADAGNGACILNFVVIGGASS